MYVELEAIGAASAESRVRRILAVSFKTLELSHQFHFNGRHDKTVFLNMYDVFQMLWCTFQVQK